MSILAKNAKPGLRYRSQKGYLFEIIEGATKGKAKKDDTNGEVKAWIIGSDGEPDKRKEYGIKFGYRLTPIKHRGRGRPAHPDKTWWGWAHDFPELPKAVLSLCESEGFYLREASNYWVAGYAGKNYLAIFRSGTIGFRLNPKDFFQGLGLKKQATRFMSYRFSLATVVSNQVADDFKTELTALLGNYKKADL